MALFTNYGNLTQYDWLRLVLSVPFTPEQRDQNTGFDPKLLEARHWKGQCLVYQANNDIKLASEVQPGNPKTEKKS